MATTEQEIGGETAEFMGHLIKLRADRMAISITVNSIGTPLNEVGPPVPPAVAACLPACHTAPAASAPPRGPPHHHDSTNPYTKPPQPAMRATRQKLYPSVGYLYPAGTQRLADVTDESQIEGALSAVPEYQKLYASVAVRGVRGFCGVLCCVVWCFFVVGWWMA